MNMANSLVPIDLDLDAVAESLDPAAISTDDRALIISQGLPGGEEMFIASTPNAIREAKLQYVRAMLIGTESPPPKPRIVRRVQGNSHVNPMIISQ